MWVQNPGSRALGLLGVTHCCFPLESMADKVGKGLGLLRSQTDVYVHPEIIFPHQAHCARELTEHHTCSPHTRALQTGMFEENDVIWCLISSPLKERKVCE